MDVDRVVEDLDRELRAGSLPGRAEHDRSYLKSEVEHYGAPVPHIRSIAKRLARRHADLTHEQLIELVEGLWVAPVHDRRLAAVELLAQFPDLVGSGDLDVLERLLREARTWAIVDPLAIGVVGPLVDRQPSTTHVLDRWSTDPDFWIRRSAMLALLLPLRRGGGDFERFARYADSMLEEPEFFIRKAIGWVLRETARKRPDLVYEWMLPRASRASGVTVREVVKPLSDRQRAEILAAR